MKKYIHIIGDQIFNIIIGTNAKENWNIIDSSDSFDLWFHVENYPSGHVIIQEQLLSKTEPILYPNQIISLAANYCKLQSKLKNKNNVKIVYTEIENIKKGKEVGSVFISKEKYLFI